MKYDVVVIGAGAAGLFCAAEAGKRKLRVLVIEHNAQIGRKILISGGGRCNFTNTGARAENFLSANPHFAKSALARYTPHDFVDLVRRHKIEYYEKKLGQLFCRHSSRQIVAMLLAECERGGVEILTACAVKNVSRGDADFAVETDRGRFRAEKLIVAAGGLSFPKIGATGFGYRLAQQFGLRVVETRPALVPLVFNDRQNFGKLAGISIDSLVSTGKVSFRENILFTHRGLSGPAILQISNYWRPEEKVSIDLLPAFDAAEMLAENRASNQRLDNFLARFLPNRFAEIFGSVKLPAKPLSQLSKKEIESAAAALNCWQVGFSETEGFDKAEVTLGGVDTDELSSQTMEAKKTPGLYFIGEVVDVTGWLGGYNFQWAWSSAYAAAQAL